MPGFTFGLDVILLVGQLRLGEHKTVDEIHHLLMERLAPLSQTISRREILFLFEAYTALLRAGTEVREDQHWREEVLRNGGLLLSLDGIQPDKGNETMYLVRDVLTGRILTAENVTSSTKAMIKQGSSAWNAWRVQHEEVRPDLGAADLGAADLSFANLSNADLSFANLNNANLNNANLSFANLSNANLSFANLNNANLFQAGLSFANLEFADLSRADLSVADLFQAYLFRANLTEATLKGADLSEATLREAKVTEEQLKETVSLEGASMPDGSKHP